MNPDRRGEPGYVQCFQESAGVLIGLHPHWHSVVPVPIRRITIPKYAVEFGNCFSNGAPNGLSIEEMPLNFVAQGRNSLCNRSLRTTSAIRWKTRIKFSGGYHVKKETASSVRLEKNILFLKIRNAGKRGRSTSAFGENGPDSNTSISRMTGTVISIWSGCTVWITFALNWPLESDTMTRVTK